METINLLSNFVKQIFTWGIGIAAVAAGISFVVGAMQFLLSATKQQTKTEAKDRMLYSLLGLLLSLGAVALLNTINPQITKLDFGNPVGEKFTGVYFSNGKDDEDVGAIFSVQDSATITAGGFNKIVYFCKDPQQDSKDPKVLVWMYPEKDFKDKDGTFKNTTTVTLSCNESVGISGKSLTIDYERAGAYYYLDKGCKGYMSTAQTSNADPLPTPFKGNIRSVRLFDYHTAVRDLTFFGVIFHSTDRSSETGTCSKLFTMNKGDDCYDVTGMQPASATVFAVPDPVMGSPDRSATFYSKPWGWQTGSFSGSAIKDFFQPETISPNNAFFRYGACQNNSACETPQYQQACKSFSDCPGSIKLSGNAFIVLSTSAQFESENSTCQVYSPNRDIPSLKETEFLGKKNPLNGIELIPLP